MEPEQKFNDGDKVEMTPETLRMNDRARSTVGVVIRAAPNHFGTIRILRDGLKTVESWNQNAWKIKNERL